MVNALLNSGNEKAATAAIRRGKNFTAETLEEMLGNEYYLAAMAVVQSDWDE
jgi:hypothetical protein